MRHLRTPSPLIFLMLFLISCAKKNYPENDLKKQLIGQWKLVSSGGGFANLPETKTGDDVMVEFTPGGEYRNYKDGVVNSESEYTIKNAGTDLEKRYVIVLKGDAPYINFTVSETELVLAGDHPDATYFKYQKIKN